MTLVASVALARQVHAQCTSNASSCMTCHETQGSRPVLEGAQPWHVDHAFADLCAACHAGDPAAVFQEQAHLGLQPPLADPEHSCGSCHDDAAALAQRYLAASTSAADAPPVSTPVRQAAAAPAGGAVADRVLALMAVALAGALYLVARRGRSRARWSVAAWLRARTWSPYTAGVLLGLVVAVSEVLCGRPLAASGAFDKLAAYPGRWLFPSSQYYRHIMAPGITWQVWLVVGILAGSFASSRLAGDARWRWLPDSQWQPRFGSSRAVRLALAFFGALLVQVGAGIAGGCTSGLAISGGAALAPAAFLFMAGMFAGGIPAAWLLYRGRAS